MSGLPGQLHCRILMSDCRKKLIKQVPHPQFQTGSVYAGVTAYPLLIHKISVNKQSDPVFMVIYKS